jgi:hypothetical protein
MKFSIYFIYSFLLFASIHLHAKHKPNIIGLKQEGTSSSLYSPTNTNGISYDTAILVKWPLNKNGQFNVGGIVIGKLVNNKFVANRTRIKVESINIPQKLGDILIDNAPILFEKMVGGVNQGVGVPMDTAILIKWPPVKSGNKFTTVSSMVTGYIQDGDFLFAQQGNRLISTTVGKYGDILINDVEIHFEKKNNGPKVEDDAIIKVQSEKKTTNTKPKQETTTLGEISAKWDKDKNPYGIVVFNNSKYGYDKAENIQEWMKENKNLKGKGEMPVPVFIIPITHKDTTIQAANGAGTRLASGGYWPKPGLKRTVVIAPPNNTPFFPEIVYGENNRLVKCTDTDGNDYYVNCPEGTENCCGLAPLPQIDLTTPAENNGNPDGDTKLKPETTTLSGILANWDKTKNPYGIVVFKNSQFVYDKAENIQEWMKGFKKLKGKKEKGYEAYYIITTTPKDTTIQAANGAGTRLAAGNASTKPGLKRIEIVSPPNNSPSSPEIIYDANTRLVKCTDKDGNDYYVNCPEGTGNCCELAPLPFIDLTSPEKQESFGSGNNHPDSTMSFKWPDDFNNSAYKDLKFEPKAILISNDGKKFTLNFRVYGDNRFVVFKDISVDYAITKMPAGTLFLTPFNGTYIEPIKSFIFVINPKISLKGGGAGTRSAIPSTRNKPGLRSDAPPPAPIGATVPQGEILFKNNGGGIKIDTAIVIYWPPVNGKDDYRQIPTPDNNMVVFSGGIVNNFKPNLKSVEGQDGQLILSRKRAKHMRTWNRVIRTDSDNENDEYNVAESINDTKNMDKSNLGVPIDTIQVIKWPEDFKKAAYKEASFEAMATFVAADGKFYFIDLDSDGDGFFDVDELASKIPAGTMLLKRGAKSRTAINGNFHTVSFTKNGDTLPTYTMQIALPNGRNLEKLFEMSDQAQNYKMREIISLHIGQAGRQTTSNEKDIPIALPYFDTNGNLLFWATKEAITLTYEKNALNNSSIAKNNKYDMDTFKSFYKTLINDYPTFAYPQFKQKPRRPRAVPHTEISIQPKTMQNK